MAEESGGGVASPLAPGLLASVGTALALGLLGILVWEAVPPGVWHDDGAYLLLGESLANGEGLNYARVSGSPPGAKFPPLYPLVLAGLWKMAPSAVGQGSLASLLNVVFIAVAGGVFVAYLRSLGFRTSGAVAATFLLFVIPDVWRLSMVPLSEPLFVLALIVALWMGSRFEESPTWGALAVFLVSFAVAYHVRTMGLVLAVAVPLALLLRGYVVWAVGAAVSALAVATPWMLWSGRAAAAIPGPLRDTLGPYGGWLARQTAVADAGYLSDMVLRLVALVGRIAAVLFPGVSGVTAIIVAIVAVAVMMLGAHRLWRNSRSPVLIGALLTVLLWLWPYQEVRLIVPLVPVLGLILVAGFWPELEALASAARRRGSRPAVQTVGIAAFGICWMLWLGWASARTLQAGGHLEALDVRVRMLARAVQAVEERVPPSGVVGAPELWAGLALHTGRRVAPSARFRTLGEGPVWGTPREQFEVWNAAEISYVVLENAGRVHKEAMDDLDSRCPGAVELLASWSGGMLVRLRWDEDCRSRVLAGT